MKSGEGHRCVDIPHPLVERAGLLDSRIGFNDLLHLPEDVSVDQQPSHLVLDFFKPIVPTIEGRITCLWLSLVDGLAFGHGHVESPCLDEGQQRLSSICRPVKTGRVGRFQKSVYAMNWLGQVIREALGRTGPLWERGPVQRQAGAGAVLNPGYAASATPRSSKRRNGLNDGWIPCPLPESWLRLVADSRKFCHVLPRSASVSG